MEVMGLGLICGSRLIRWLWLWWVFFFFFAIVCGYGGFGWWLVVVMVSGCGDCEGWIWCPAALG